MDVPVADVQAIEVRRGSHVGRGAVIGAAVGVAAGFLLGLQVADPGMCVTNVGGGCDRASGAGVLAFTTLVSGALGTGLGALFGLGSPTWEPAP